MHTYIVFKNFCFVIFAHNTIINRTPLTIIGYFVSIYTKEQLQKNSYVIVHSNYILLFILLYKQYVLLYLFIMYLLFLSFTRFLVLFLLIL